MFFNLLRNIIPSNDIKKLKRNQKVQKEKNLNI